MPTTKKSLISLDSGGAGSSVFGTEFEKFQSLAESTTSSSTFQDKINAVTASKPAGTYRVEFNCQITNSKSEKTTKLRMTANGVQLHNHSNNDIKERHSKNKRCDY